MTLSQKQILEQDVFEHPHANIVREVIVAFLEKVAADHEHCNACLDPRPHRLDYNTPRQTMHSRLYIQGEVIKPITIRFERRGHLPDTRRRLRLVHDAYGASITSLAFFRKHNFHRYGWKESASDFQVNQISSHLFDCLRELEEYCVFKADVYLPEPHKVITSEGRVRIYIGLRDELNTLNTYDFLTSITINCPREAERATVDSNQRKKDNQSRIEQKA